MAARSHVDVNERRLRPIYDCLDNGNNKEALREAEKVLKKQKDLQCAKVLKCLALMRLGRLDESSSLLFAVHAEKPKDESTLQAMTICYRETNKLDLIAEVYSNAHKQQPDNEEIMTCLFMAYVRLGDYKKQQQIAMTLYKSKPKTPYYFWAIMSIVMQAHMDAGLARTMFLPLAEKMAEKHIKDDKVESEAEVALYLIILEESGKFEEALEVLHGQLGDKLKTELDFSLSKRIEYLRHLEKWSDLNALYRKQLLENADDWQSYLGYFESMFALLDSGWTPSSNIQPDHTVDYTIEAVIEFVKEQVNAVDLSNKPIRGPALARLELYKQLGTRSNPIKDNLGNLRNLLEDYFEIFGRKPCCFLDMSPYIKLLDATDQEKLLNKIAELAKSTDWMENIVLPTFENKQHVQQHLTLCQLCRFCGQHNTLPLDKKTSIIRSLCQAFTAACQLESDKEQLPMDTQFITSYVVLAVHLLIDLYEETKDQEYIWQSIGHLESTLYKSPADFQVKLLLIKLYSMLGAFGACTSLYDSLDIKHLQHDTMGYIVCNDMERYGHFGASCSYYDTTLRFFTSNIKDILEYIISAYKYGSFTKVYEFIQFRDRLETSLQYAVTTTSRMLLELTMDCDCHSKAEEAISLMHIDPLHDETVWDCIKDNRDLDIMISWSPGTHNLGDESFTEEKAWLKTQNLIIRCLAVTVLGTSTQDNSPAVNGNIGHGDNGDTDGIKVLENLTKTLEEHLAWCRKEFDDNHRRQLPIQGPSHTKLLSFLDRKQDEVYLNAFKATIYVKSCQNNETLLVDKENTDIRDKLSQGTVGVMKAIVLEVQKTIEASKGTSTSLNMCSPDALADVVLVSETISNLAIICGACHKLLKPMKSHILKKKKKKGGQENPLPLIFGCFSGVFKSLTELAADVSLIAQATVPKFVEDEFQDIHIEETVEKSDKVVLQVIRQKIENSYKQSANDIGEILKRKTKYMQSLKL